MGSCTAPRLESSTVTGCVSRETGLPPLAALTATAEIVTLADRILPRGASLTVTTMGAAPAIVETVGLEEDELHPSRAHSPTILKAFSTCFCDVFIIGISNSPDFPQRSTGWVMS